MKQTEAQSDRESLYLEVSSVNGAVSLPLHSSIVLFLLSYTECSSFHACLVTDQADILPSLSGLVPGGLTVSGVRRDELPRLVKMCRLPAALEPDVCFCRAGLAVVLRHIIKSACQLMPSRRDVASLLGFKNTCLKACAEVSQWTRLCELDIPSAVEEHLRNPEDQVCRLPAAILNLEKRLGEPVKVHNDDKIRRQKLQQQKKSDSQLKGPSTESEDRLNESHPGVELSAALAKLSVAAVPSPSTRESSDIRKVKSTDLPELEHVFAEGLYFTLTDVVLLPCIHQYLISIQKHTPSTLSRLPLLLRWYQRVQELPSVLRAAKDCGMALFSPSSVDPCPPQPEAPRSSGAEQDGPKLKQEPFIGGPRPTLTKLQENGIDAVYSPHPCPSWTVDWESLPMAVNPTEGKMSDARAVRKQQQLNNLLAMVTDLAHPGNTVVDFCSGGGHVGIVLAYTLPKCQVILIENKEESLVRARDRSAQLGLTNMGFIQTNLDYFTGNFNIGVALHACGVATDMVLDRCLQARAGFVISPCCYGFIQNTLKFNFPKSTRFAETLSYKEHMILCRFADQTAVSLPLERRLIGKRCMGLVDLDRSWAAETHGYSVRVMTMVPEGCSPKNNMLVGFPTT
ncbi:glutathione S-transferase C-terminal domain-containing protein [Rhinichthys klamathensis goyatoka]|uniref:glutathione S-transferase C-terminal domain-containing protein n=1 Tax=Rhinichthys klamathensis goyatoka TaxID=3034132 RepID=UPI0024B568B9|nr:glutathione S-transferase C-terminal domain-containing protein [Rhinichthys klamathensis goyatoka]XP_056109556.1 glutathione S-transferase C-terminal domain-containing protein [Rhinichthys klamathensis goyatoka]XP_056109557.1 glutathione S-transferase C-terminal domain-containing protein [Rhinichthys klamathensis goyatoka]